MKNVSDELIENEKKLFSVLDKTESSILKYIEPVNSVREEKRFFECLQKREEYNPRFEYLAKNPVYSHFTLTPEFKKLKKKLKNLSFSDNSMGKIFEKKKKDALSQMDFIRSIGGKHFTKHSINFYGWPSKKIVDSAFFIVENIKSERKRKKKIESEKAKNFFEKILLKKRIDYKVELDENLSTRAVVYNYENKLKINSLETFNEFDLNKLKVHEIETHIYRYLNGLIQPLRIFLEGTSNQWLSTEEGLAVFNEHLFGLNSNNSLREYAGRVLAIKFGYTKGFYETFMELNNFFDKKTSYLLTKRVKRGMFDTSMPGCFTKDHYYLRGLIEVSKFVYNGGNLRDLYYGKISVNDVSQISKTSFIKKPQFMPKYRAKKHMIETAEKIFKKINYYNY